MTGNASALTPDQGSMFLEIAEASLRVTQREHLFSWLQGCFQYLFPHEVMVCGIGAFDSDDFRFESFSSTRYFSESHAKKATLQRDGLVWKAMKAWQQVRRPLMLGNGLLAGDYGSYVVPFPDEDDGLIEMELCNIAAHGMGEQNGNVSTFFCFSRVPQQPGETHAYLLELLIPYLHSALIRVAATNDNKASRRVCVQLQQITVREREILHWLKTGKTNWEIAQILSISPLTVKNHVQNILRKLNVQNRSHAAAKAEKLGTVSS
jgi:transcriptional regulator EpsA